MAFAFVIGGLIALIALADSDIWCLRVKRADREDSDA